MENEIYQILKKHKLPLKKREEVLTDLLLLFSAVGRSEQFSCYLEDSEQFTLEQMRQAFDAGAWEHHIHDFDSWIKTLK